MGKSASTTLSLIHISNSKQAGTGLSGVILPLVFQWLLNSYGYQTTLRVWALTLFIMGGPLLYFIKPRIPISSSLRPRPLNWSFLKERSFAIYQLGNTLEALGYFLPTIYLPSYARTLGASSLYASLTAILFNVGTVIGCVIMGSFVDRYHATTCILISTVGSTVAVFVLWGVAMSLAPLYVFCIAYGLFAGSFTSTWPAVWMAVRRHNAFADAGLVFGFLCAGRGIGNVVSGPLSEALMKVDWTGVGGAYAGSYGCLVLFTGVSALLGGVSVLGRPLRWV